jgi:hypothetical protein
MPPSTMGSHHWASGAKPPGTPAAATSKKFGRYEPHSKKFERKICAAQTFGPEDRFLGRPNRGIIVLRP